MRSPFGFTQGDIDFGRRGRHPHGPHGHGHDPHGHDPHARGRHGGPFGGPGGFGPGGFGPGGFGPFGFDPRTEGFRGGRGRGKGRQRRGDVRAAVLALLAERPMHGYEIIREISERSGNAWRPSPGSVYPLLQQLADEELVTEDEQTARGGKKLFTLTEAGSQEAERHTENPPWEQVAADAADIPPEDGNLRSAIGQLGGAAMQLFAVASPEQKARAARILNNARKELYTILSEDADETEESEDTER